MKTNRKNPWPSRNQRVVYYNIDNHTGERIRHDFILNEEMKGILLGIWRAGVYYIRKGMDYGHPVCDIAINDARDLDPPQILTYEIIEVNQSH
jgi:hypothetical protein